MEIDVKYVQYNLKNDQMFIVNTILKWIRYLLPDIQISDTPFHVQCISKLSKWFSIRSPPLTRNAQKHPASKIHYSTGVFEKSINSVYTRIQKLILSQMHIFNGVNKSVQYSGCSPKEIAANDAVMT